METIAQTDHTRTALLELATLINRSRMPAAADDRSQPMLALLNEPEPSAVLTQRDRHGQKPVDLGEVFDAMREAGYQLGTPICVGSSAVSGYSEWRIAVATTTIAFTLKFYVAQVRE